MSFSFPLSALPRFLRDDFLKAMLNLLPRGRAWPKFSESNMAQALSALTPTYERLSQQATNLLADAFPVNTLQLLPEWELSLGLPDPCAGELNTVSARQSQVVARFLRNGGQSVPYIIDFAANLGYTITITEDDGFRMGQSRMGVSSFSDINDRTIFYWYVHSPLYNLRFFEMGVSVMGDPLGSIDANTVLECEIRSLAPANTIPIFEYS